MTLAIKQSEYEERLAGLAEHLLVPRGLVVGVQAEVGIGVR